MSLCVCVCVCSQLLPLFLEALGCCNECVCVCSQLLPLFLEALSCPDVGVL